MQLNNDAIQTIMDIPDCMTIQKLQYITGPDLFIAAGYPGNNKRKTRMYKYLVCS